MMTRDEERKLEDVIQGSVYSFLSNGGEERWQADEDRVIEHVNRLLAERDAEIERLKEQSRILKDKLETANDTIKRLQSNQIPEMDDLSHNARAAFYKSILPKRVIEAWQSASDVLDGKGGDWKASLTSVYERLDDILAEFELF